MEKSVAGDVVVVPFPFSDLSSTKKRPTLVVAALEGDDNILCQITTQTTMDNYSITLEAKDFQLGKLSVPSLVRPNKLFTTDQSLILYKAGSVKSTKLDEVIDKICTILKQSSRSQKN